MKKYTEAICETLVVSKEAIHLFGWPPGKCDGNFVLDVTEEMMIFNLVAVGTPYQQTTAAGLGHVQ